MKAKLRYRDENWLQQLCQCHVAIIEVNSQHSEILQKLIHHLTYFSHRANSPFVAIHCSELSPELIDSELFGHVKGSFTSAHKDHQGVLKQAQGGTLF